MSSSHPRPEILRDAATIMDAMQIQDYMTPKEVEKLQQCYQDNSCDPAVMEVLRKYDTKGYLDMNGLKNVLDGSKVVCDLRKVVQEYDADGDGKLSPAELQEIARDYEQKRNTEVCSIFGVFAHLLSCSANGIATMTERLMRYESIKCWIQRESSCCQATKGGCF